MKKFNLSILISIIFTINLIANDKYSFINITSNIEGADVYLDKIKIGKTPIFSYKVFNNTNINLSLSANKKYYPNDINKTFFIQKNTNPTFDFQFKKGQGEISFYGPDGHLYINDEFITTLEKHNRTIKYPANDNIKIEITNNNKRFSIQKNLYVNEPLDITYKLKEVNLEANLYTLTYNDVMWQDDTESKNKNLIYEDAQRYCKELELAGYTNWEIPSVEQLKSLYEIKDKLYNGIGTKAYWSSNQDLNSSEIWKYSDALDFENGKVEKKVQSFFDGNIRCVRPIN